MDTPTLNALEHTPMDFLTSEGPELLAKTRPFKAYIDDLKRKGIYSYHREMVSACMDRARIREPNGTEREVIVLAALQILETDSEPRNRLWRNVDFLHGALTKAGVRGFPDPPESAVITVPIGPDAIVHKMGLVLYERGVFTGSVIYPAVPRTKAVCASACRRLIRMRR